jgi:5-oxoprolinase (ATP-hydrolysing) subunit A
VHVIDLNADLGESFGSFAVGRDAELIPLLTSAHLACGFHGGDPRVMDRTVRACRGAGVAVGAHPGFPDLVGFGRRVIETSGEEVETDVLYQVAALDGFCRRHGVTMQHVKPHGALYNHANRSAEVAKGVAAAIASYDPRLMLVCQFGTELARAGEAAGLTVAYEGFVDRAYNPDGSLVSRSVEGSVLHDPGRAAEQALGMVTEGTVVAIDGTVAEVRADTLCAHGDNPDAVELIRDLRQRLTGAGIALAPMREVVAARRAGPRSTTIGRGRP